MLLIPLLKRLCSTSTVSPADSELHAFLEEKGIIKSPMQAKRDELVSGLLQFQRNKSTSDISTA